VASHLLAWHLKRKKTIAELIKLYSYIVDFKLKNIISSDPVNVPSPDWYHRMV